MAILPELLISQLVPPGCQPLVGLPIVTGGQASHNPFSPSCEEKFGFTFLNAQSDLGPVTIWSPSTADPIIPLNTGFVYDSIWMADPADGTTLDLLMPLVPVPTGDGDLITSNGVEESPPYLYQTDVYGQTPQADLLQYLDDFPGKNGWSMNGIDVSLSGDPVSYRPVVVLNIKNGCWQVIALQVVSVFPTEPPLDIFTLSYVAKQVLVTFVPPKTSFKGIACGTGQEGPKDNTYSYGGAVRQYYAPNYTRTPNVYGPGLFN